jgi:hypothetical protein
MSSNLSSPVSAQFTRLARRVEDDPFFLAGVLRVYADAHGLDEQSPAGELGCAIETLPQLALCRRPASATFDQDVATIAARFRVDATVLAAMVRAGR